MFKCHIVIVVKIIHFLRYFFVYRALHPHTLYLYIVSLKWGLELDKEIKKLRRVNWCGRKWRRDGVEWYIFDDLCFMKWWNKMKREGTPLHKVKFSSTHLLSFLPPSLRYQIQGINIQNLIPFLRQHSFPFHSIPSLPAQSWYPNCLFHVFIHIHVSVICMMINISVNTIWSHCQSLWGKSEEESSRHFMTLTFPLIFLPFSSFCRKRLSCLTKGQKQMRHQFCIHNLTGVSMSFYYAVYNSSKLTSFIRTYVVVSFTWWHF